MPKAKPLTIGQKIVIDSDLTTERDLRHSPCKDAAFARLVAKRIDRAILRSKTAEWLAGFMAGQAPSPADDVGGG